MIGKKTIYLDYAAATPLDREVLVAMQPYFTDYFYNPSATYAAAREVHAALEAARASIAHWLGARGSEITLTAGGTEANNLAIHGVMRQYPEANIVVSAIEHESVLVPAGRYDCRQVNVTSDGLIDLEDLARKIDEQTVMVSVMYANNEIGTVQPVREVTRIIAAKKATRRAEEAVSRQPSAVSPPTTSGQRTASSEQRPASPLPLIFHSDACQAANYLDMHVARLGVDMLTLNGGKLYGPKQSGALYVKAGVRLQPLIDGGGQERGLRSGTENVAAAIGCATALDKAQTLRHEETRRLQALQQQFLELLEQKIPQAVINGSRRHRLPNNIHLTMPGYDNERLLIQLDELGIQAAAGSACSASDQEPSHVLRALGLSEAEARASLRFTMGRATTADMIKNTVSKLTQLIVS